MKCVSQRILTFSVAVTWTVVKRDGQRVPNCKIDWLREQCECKQFKNS